MGQELQHLGRDVLVELLGLRLQNAQAQLIGRRVNVGDQAPSQARAHALLHALQIARRLVGGDHHLPVLIDQRVEGMEELLLGGLAPADELHIIDHQDVDRAELFLESNGILGPERSHELKHELLRREVDDPLARLALLDMQGNGMHQMRLAQADAAVEEKRVEGNALSLRHPACRGIGQLVRLADNEIVECEAWIERRGDVPAIAGDAVETGIAAGRPRALHRERGFALGRGAGWLRWSVVDRRLHIGSARWLHDDLDTADGVILILPQREDAFLVVPGYPVAHEP